MKVKQVQSTGSFDMSINGQPTTLYSFEYEFDDNSSGFANHKTQEAPFKAGDEVLVEENGISPRGDRKIKVKSLNQVHTHPKIQRNPLRRVVVR